MKNILGRTLSIFLVGAMIIAGITGCNGAPSASPAPVGLSEPNADATQEPTAAGSPTPVGLSEPNADAIQAPTTSLVVYDVPGYTSMLRKAIGLFKEQYPGVSVEFRMYDGAPAKTYSSGYINWLETDILSGQGPDIVLLEMDMMGYLWAKTLDEGIYASLEPYAMQDNDFNKSDYNEAFLDAGVYKGIWYSMPLFFKTDVWITTQAILDAHGMDILQEELNMSEFAAQLEAFTMTNPDMQFLKSMKWPKQLATLLPWCGLEWVDYEEKRIITDTEDFRFVVDLYKQYFYPGDWRDQEGFFMSSELSLPLENGECIFTCQINLMQVLASYSQLKASDQQPVVINVPSFDGKSTAAPIVFAQIRADSPNQYNAYNFLKILLSEEIQSDIHLFEQISAHKLPVSRSAMVSVINQLVQEFCPPDRYVKLGDGTLIQLDELTSTDIDLIMDRVYEVDRCINNLGFEVSASYDLKPYFDDEAPYASLIVEATDNLTQWLNE